MSDDPNQRSVLIAEFSEIGSVVFRVLPQNVTPFQLLALAGYLEVEAKDAIIREKHAREAEHEQQRLSVPSPKIMIPGK